METGLDDVTDVTASADGSVLAVRAEVDGEGVLAVGSPDGDFRTVNLDGTLSDPALSPDGERLAFTRSDGNDTGVFVVPVAGGEPTEVAASSAEESEPTWSPDGSQLALLRQVSDGQAVVVASASTGAVEATLAAGGAKRSPTWSPDGASLAWIGRRNERWDPVVLESMADDGEPRLLSTDAEETAVAFGGDGNLVVAQNRSGVAAVEVATGTVTGLDASGDVEALATFTG